MFREGRLVQKNKRCCKNMHVFFHHFLHLFFNEKSIPDHAQNVQTVTFTKIVKKSRLERLFGIQNRSFVDFWIPSGSPGASQDVTEAAQSSFFFHESEEASENQPLALPGRLNGDARETPAVT